MPEIATKITCEHCGGSGYCTIDSRAKGQGRRRARNEVGHKPCGRHNEITMGGRYRSVIDNETCGYCGGHGETY